VRTYPWACPSVPPKDRLEFRKEAYSVRLDESWKPRSVLINRIRPVLVNLPCRNKFLRPGKAGSSLLRIMDTNSFLKHGQILLLFAIIMRPQVVHNILQKLGMLGCARCQLLEIVKSFFDFLAVARETSFRLVLDGTNLVVSSIFISELLSLCA